MSIYLDYNASAPIDSRVLEVMVDVYQNHFGNADSRTHDFGEKTRSITEKARGQVASLIGIRNDEVVFTSGATESNNLAILGLRHYGELSKRKHIITSSIEHKAVLEAVDYLSQNGFEVEYVDPDESGRIDSQQIVSMLRPDTLLVSIMHVNNETGIIQPVKEIGEFLKSSQTLFHIDATQSCGKLIEEIRELSYDLMSVSAHKMHGPQGVGALIMRRKRYKLPPVSPIMFGGGQEHGVRPGTLPVALIAGFGKACDLAKMESDDNNAQCQKTKEILLRMLSNSGVSYEINGDQNYCVSNTLNVSFIGVSSEALMLATKQYCGVSNGSACTSKKYSHSHVLSAMHLPDERIESAIRISWGADVSYSEVADAFNNLIETVRQLSYYDQLKEFVGNENEYSMEHFIISETKTRLVVVSINDAMVEYKYNEKFFKRYVNSMFNLIFVSKKINTELGNNWLPAKEEIIQNKPEIKCDYSKMVISISEDLSNKLRSLSLGIDNYQDKLDLFFSRDFKDLYIEYSRKVLEAVINRIKTA